MTRRMFHGEIWFLDVGCSLIEDVCGDVIDRDAAIVNRESLWSPGSGDFHLVETSIQSLAATLLSWKRKKICLSICRDAVEFGAG